MKISNVVALLEDFDNDVVHSDITLGVHRGCDCCGGNYGDDLWDTMTSTYDKTEDKVKKFCDENNLVYDWGVFDDDDLAKLDFTNKSSFDTLYQLFSDSNISASIEDYGDDLQAYHDMRDYYAEDLEIFLNFCVSLGFEKDL